MLGTELKDIICPYCGESIEIVVDTSVANQEYIEDCQVCCRPITLRAEVLGDSVQLQALDENEY
jgi:hypothetical protein